jgi:hypothetical protein
MKLAIALATLAALWIPGAAGAAGVPGPLATPADAASAPLSYAEWREPGEGAFTVSVPAGWSVEGGVTWNSLFSPRQWVRVRSPDNQVVAFVGAPNLLPRMVPNPAYDQLGWTAGTVQRTPVGTQVLMWPYRTGEEFAFDETVQTICGQPNNLGFFRRRNETAALTQALAPFSPYLGLTITSGEFYYRCGSIDGYTQATTLLVGQNGPGVQNWDIFWVAGFSSNGGPAAYEEGEEAFLHLAASFTPDPGWLDSLYAHQHLADDTAQRASQAIENMMLKSGQNALDVHTRMVNRFSDIILGQEHRCDDIGNCQETTNRCDYVWRNAQGMACGPSDGSPPPEATGPWRPTHIAE